MTDSDNDEPYDETDEDEEGEAGLIQEGYGSQLDVWTEEAGFNECPYCGAGVTHLDQDSKSEYTGGGYGEYWYVLRCDRCEREWETEHRYGMM